MSGAYNLLEITRVIFTASLDRFTIYLYFVSTTA